MKQTVLLLGSNIDNRLNLLASASSLIIAQIGPLVAASSIYESDPWGFDVLLYEELIICTDNLEIPHPRMHQRRFCMEPLAEIAPNWVVPTFQKTTSQVLALCSDPSKISTLNA